MWSVIVRLCDSVILWKRDSDNVTMWFRDSVIVWNCYMASFIELAWELKNFVTHSCSFFWLFVILSEAFCFIASLRWTLNPTAKWQIPTVCLHDACVSYFSLMTSWRGRHNWLTCRKKWRMLTSTCHTFTCHTFTCHTYIQSVRSLNETQHTSVEPYTHQNTQNNTIKLSNNHIITQSYNHIIT